MSKSPKPCYAIRDIVKLDKAGGYYVRHIEAMTAESLRSKTDIAAELAYRDMVIDLLASTAIGLIEICELTRPSTGELEATYKVISDLTDHD